MWLKLIPWLVFLHTLSAFAFFLAHGTSVAMAFKIRSETNFDRIRAMMDLSYVTQVWMGISFLVMGLSGLVMPFILKLWGKGWIWLSIGLMLVVFVHMVIISEKRFKPLRRLVGLPYMVGGKHFPPEEPANPQDVQAQIAKIKVIDLVIVGMGFPAFVLWLMVFKPF